VFDLILNEEVEQPVYLLYLRSLYTYTEDVLWSEETNGTVVAAQYFSGSYDNSHYLAFECGRLSGLFLGYSSPNGFLLGIMPRNAKFNNADQFFLI
jgi:hypothetical protein